jgi:hypothetical protein
MLTTMFSQGNIGANTTPDETRVTQFISWTAAQIDLQFQSAGYVLPLAIISGETWPAHQTTYLQLVNTMAAAAMAGGYSLKPAPATAPGRQGGTGNIYGDLFNAELRKIFDPQTGQTTLRFRANYYAGSPAQISVTEPKGPTTDFLEGRFDPMRQYTQEQMADRILEIQDSMAYLQLNWDYMYGLFDINKGLGEGQYEDIRIL